jgi:hypothetical protein
MEPSRTFPWRSHRIRFANDDARRRFDRRKAFPAESQYRPPGSAHERGSEPRIAIAVRHAGPGFAEDRASLEQACDMVGEVGKLSRPGDAASVRAGSLESREHGDGAKQRHCRVCASRGAANEDTLKIETTAELAARLHVVEQYGQVARPLPQAQEPFGAIGLRAGIAMMIDRNGDESLPGQSPTEPFKAQACSSGPMREKADRIGTLRRMDGRIARGRAECEPWRGRGIGKQLLLDRIVGRRIPGDPSQRSRAVAVPIWPRLVVRSALAKSDAHHRAPVGYRVGLQGSMLTRRGCWRRGSPSPTSRFRRPPACRRRPASSAWDRRRARACAFAAWGRPAPY